MFEYWIRGDYSAIKVSTMSHSELIEAYNFLKYKIDNGINLTNYTLEWMEVIKKQIEISENKIQKTYKEVSLYD